MNDALNAFVLAFHFSFLSSIGDNNSTSHLKDISTIQLWFRIWIETSILMEVLSHSFLEDKALNHDDIH